MALDPDEVLKREIYELSAEEAAEVLEAFLWEEAKVFKTLRIGGIELDYTRRSVEQLFRYVVDEDRMGTYSKDDPFGFWVLRLAYYFGEAHRRVSNRLEWGTGDPEYAFANHPVIRGFAKQQEAEMIVICRNLLSAVALDGEEFRRIERAIDEFGPR